MFRDPGFLGPQPGGGLHPGGGDASERGPEWTTCTKYRFREEKGQFRYCRCGKEVETLWESARKMTIPRFRNLRPSLCRSPRNRKRILRDFPDQMLSEFLRCDVRPTCLAPASDQATRKLLHASPKRKNEFLAPRTCSAARTRSWPHTQGALPPPFLRFHLSERWDRRCVRLPETRAARQARVPLHNRRCLPGPARTKRSCD